MSMHKPTLKKIRGSAQGVAYTGLATHWACEFGRVIIIANDLQSLEAVARKMQELKPHQTFEPDLCPKVACFQMTDVKEVA
jgi:hypothetical protein